MFFFITTILTLLMAAYVIKSVVLPLSVALWIRVVLAVLILIGSQKMGIYWFLGNIFPFLQMRGVMIFFGIAQAWILMMFLGAIVLNVLSLFKVFIPAALPIMLIATLLIAVFSVWQALRVPSVKKVNVALSGLSQSWQPLRIVQLSDLHIGSGFNGKWLSLVVEKTNALKPDLILITGDLIDGSPTSLMPELQPLKKLKAPQGVLMVYGNHEYYYGPERWMPAFKELGLDIVMNEARVLDNAGTPFVVGGLPMPGANRFSLPAPQLSKTFEKVDKDLPRFLMAHYPSQVQDAAKHQVLMQFSGHTHGGQLFWPLNIPASSANNGFLKGFYQVGPTRLYVSSGTGLWGGFPVRLGTTPEITLFTIERAENHGA